MGLLDLALGLPELELLRQVLFTPTNTGIDACRLHVMHFTIMQALPNVYNKNRLTVVYLADQQTIRLTVALPIDPHSATAVS